RNLSRALQRLRAAAVHAGDLEIPRLQHRPAHPARRFVTLIAYGLDLRRDSAASTARKSPAKSLAPLLSALDVSARAPVPFRRNSLTKAFPISPALWRAMAITAEPAPLRNTPARPGWRNARHSAMPGTRGLLYG